MEADRAVRADEACVKYMEDDTRVRAGQWVIIATNGEKRLLKVDASSRVHIYHACLPALGLVGVPFGSIVTSADGKLAVDERLAEDITGTFAEWERAAEADDEQRTNKALFDDGTAQALSAAGIAKLREQGLQGEELVREIAQNSATFEGKTSFSQHKYLKKKAKKYTPVVQVIRPTPVELCEVYAHVGKLDKIHELRADSLALLLLRSNVRAGARVLVLDTGIGLVSGALAQRLGGHGSLLVAHAKAHVPLDGLQMLNLRADEWAAVSAAPLDDVRNALEDMAAPGAQPAGAAAAETAGAAGAEEPSSQAAPASSADAGGDAALPVAAPAAAGEPSRAAGKSTFRRVTPEETAAWLADGCDSLVISMHATAPELLRVLVRALRPSGSVCVYNACMQPLAQAARELQAAGSPLMSVQLGESWAREYQVLPNRTHPVMINVLPSGYVLSGFARPRGGGL